MMRQSSVTLCIILGSLLLMGYLVYQTPEKSVRPTFPSSTGPAAIQQIDAHSLVKQIGFVKATLVKEASALCRSKKHPGIYWTLCDSGNLPFLFAIDTTGKLHATIRLEGVPNVDWEALAMDDEGRLYVGDIGNNYHNLRQRSIYRIDEPARLDHQHPQEPQTVPVTGKWHYTFPSKPFDAESLLIQDGIFWIISKVKHAAGTHVYRLDMNGLGSTQVIQEAGKLPDALMMIADASLSPDQKRLALVNKFYAAIFELPHGKVSDICSCSPTLYEFDLHKLEGCAWEGDDLIMISEDRKVYRLPGVGSSNGVK